MSDDLRLVGTVAQPVADLVARRTGLGNFSAARVALAAAAISGVVAVCLTTEVPQKSSMRVAVEILIVVICLLGAVRCDMDARRSEASGESDGMHALAPEMMLVRILLLFFLMPMRCLDVAVHGVHAGDAAMLGAIALAVVGFYLHACWSPPRPRRARAIGRMRVAET